MYSNENIATKAPIFFWRLYYLPMNKGANVFPNGTLVIKLNGFLLQGISSLKYFHNQVKQNF